MRDALGILQIEDSESDAALIVRVLEKAGYHVDALRVDDAESMRDALSMRKWDAIICDHRMAQFDAAQALEVLHETRDDIPFIVVSGSIGEDVAVSLMKAGAQDYLLKDSLARLVPVVEREIKEARMRRDRRRAAGDLRESEERLALAVKATQLGTFDCDPVTGNLIWAYASRRHFGLSPEAPVSYEVFLKAVHPADRERVDGGVQAALNPASGGRYEDEFRVIGIEDGIERWIDARGEVFYGTSGEPVRFVGVMLDITERKKLEEQFRQAQKLESIGRLAGGVAHDFNNLLTVIGGYANMILDEIGATHPLHDSISEISAASERASDLTRQLLAFGRRNLVELRTVLVNDLLQNFKKMLGRLLGEQIQVVLALSDSAGAIKADPGQLEQVVMNLAVNAKDAMANGGKLVIETSQITADEHFAHAHPPITPGVYVMIAISDTGTGMTADVQAHMFEPFFTTKESGKGTGLGLATVYGIVKQSGGLIWVYSEPGRGTTFKLLFPAVDTVLGSTLMADETLIPRGHAERILLVEDEESVRKYASQVLQRHGYQVMIASNGREAIDAARCENGKIDLFLLDVVLPGMTIMELLRELKSMRPHVPVLCMSGYSDLLLLENQSHANFIQKPFGPSALLKQIGRMLHPSNRSEGSVTAS